MVALEDLFDCQCEYIGDLESQRQGRVIAPLFNRIDALARDAQLIGEILLAPIAFRAENFEAVLHTAPQLPYWMRLITAPTNNPKNHTIGHHHASA